MDIKNSTTLPKFYTSIDDVILGVAPSAPAQFTATDAWNQTYRNFSIGAVQVEEETDLSFLLPTRMAVIAGVIIALFIVTWGSYTIHRKCVKDSWKHKYQKAMFLW